MEMIRNQVKLLVNLVVSQVYHLLWLIIHLLYRWQFEIRDKLQTNARLILQRLFSCLPMHSYYGELANLSKITETLHKIPKHVAFSVVENVRATNWRSDTTSSTRSSSSLRRKSHSDRSDEGSHEEPIDLQLLAKVISWAWVARISVVSLYDYHGVLKRSHRELGCYVQEEVIQNYWALKKYGKLLDLPTIKFHNVPKLNGYSNGLGAHGVCQDQNSTSASTPLHIVVFSYEDGKSDLIRATKLLYIDHLATSTSHKLKSNSDSNSLSPLVLTRNSVNHVKNGTQNQLHNGSDNKKQSEDWNGAVNHSHAVRRRIPDSDQDDSVSSSNEIHTDLDKVLSSQPEPSSANSIDCENNSISRSDSDCSWIENSENIVSPSMGCLGSIDETTIDAVLNRNHTWPSHTGISTEPDVLFILGNIQSTLGFLPWHIRLTEIHWLPKLQIVETKDFVQVLKKFARCEQRFGS